MNTERKALVAGLRALADDLENGDVPAPTHPPAAEWLIFGSHRAKEYGDQKAAAATIVTGMGGKWDKGPGSDLFFFTKDYGGGVKAKVVVEREKVCERVVTGTETVTLPAKEAVPEQVVEREIVEWRCEPLLGAEVSS